MSVPSGFLEPLLGQEVVLDMTSPFVHLGTLTRIDEHYLVLENADVHDLRDTSTTRELYIVDSRRFGIRANRKCVFVRLREVVSLSALTDVLL